MSDLFLFGALSFLFLDFLGGFNLKKEIDLFSGCVVIIGNCLSIFNTITFRDVVLSKFIPARKLPEAQEKLRRYPVLVRKKGSLHLLVKSTSTVVRSTD